MLQEVLTPYLLHLLQSTRGHAVSFRKVALPVVTYHLALDSDILWHSIFTPVLEKETIKADSHYRSFGLLGLRKKAHKTTAQSWCPSSFFGSLCKSFSN